MASRLFPSPLFHLLSPFLLLVLLNSAASSDYEEWFLNCERPNCDGNISLEIPLLRNNGTGFCGYAGPIKLYCEANYETIEIWGAKYQLLGFSQKDQILIIAELGFSSRFCMPDKNSPIQAMIPVSSDCEHPEIQRKPTCPGAELRYIPFENIAANADPHCVFSAVVPISSSSLKELDDLKKVAQDIKAKFHSKLKVDAQVCRSCSVPVGVCGYGLPSDQTRCYCHAPSTGFEVCPSSPSPVAEVPKTAPASGMLLFSLQN